MVCIVYTKSSITEPALHHVPDAPCNSRPHGDDDYSTWVERRCEKLNVWRAARGAA